MELKNISLTDHGINRSRERFNIEEESDFLFEAKLKLTILNALKNGNSYFENLETIYLNSGTKDKKNKKELMFVLKRKGDTLTLVTTKPSDVQSNFRVLDDEK